MSSRCVNRRSPKATQFCLLSDVENRKNATNRKCTEKGLLKIGVGWGSEFGGYMPSVCCGSACDELLMLMTPERGAF